MTQVDAEEFRVESQALSREYFGQLEAYAELTRDSIGRYIGGCIHPTLASGIEVGTYPTMINTPGGEAGAAINQVLVNHAVYGVLPKDGETDLLQAVESVPDLFSSVAWTSHFGCLLIEKRRNIIDQMARPSDFVKDYIRGSSMLLEVHDELTSKFPRIQSAAQRCSDAITAYDEKAILAHASEAQEVQQPNVAATYVLNFVENLGVNNSARQNDPRKQAYHDSPAAYKKALVGVETMDNFERGYHLAANLLLSAATYFAIVEDSARHDEFTTYAVMPSNRTPAGYLVDKLSF